MSAPAEEGPVVEARDLRREYVVHRRRGRFRRERTVSAAVDGISFSVAPAGGAGPSAPTGRASPPPGKS